MTLLAVFDTPGVPAVAPVSGFDEAWELHPLKKDRKRAVESYSRARKVTTHELIMLRVRLYAASVRRGEVRDVSSLSSFLNRVDWNPTPRGRR